MTLLYLWHGAIQHGFSNLVREFQKRNANAAEEKGTAACEKEARRRARLGIGMPPPERVIVEKRQKPPKHKKKLTEVIEE